MPPNAVGITIRTIVFHLGTPSAYDASRRSFGTILSISSVDRTITGIIRIVSAKEAANPERSKPNVSTQKV